MRRSATMILSGITLLATACATPSEGPAHREPKPPPAPSAILQRQSAPPAAENPAKPHPAKDERPSVSAVPARVRRVIDGDTIEVIPAAGRTEKVRMIGVNTPELSHPDLGIREQPYGPEAAAYSRKALAGRQVFLETDVQERDKYGRLLAYVWLSKPERGDEEEIRTRMFNARLLLDGYAQTMTVPPNVRYADMFRRFQAEAREAGRGLWHIPPKPQTAATEPGGEQSGRFSPDRNGNCIADGQPRIKGNANSMIYHLPGGAYYAKTRAEDCFYTEEDAVSAGYRRSKR